ncbi:MAG: hypothetical protein ACI8S6_000260, partial [Myxococcota bacterium]
MLPLLLLLLTPTTQAACSPEAIRAQVVSASMEQGDERLAQGQAALSAVACLDDWADPPLAAQIHQLAAQLAGEEDDP